MGYAVGEVARLAGVTVRALHHYDEIGLLSPRERSAGGYRRYDDADLDRLQQVLFYRELGFGLDEVSAILDDPGTDVRDHLRRQHRLLRARIQRLQRMVESIERSMEANRMGINLSPRERFEVFGDFDPADHEQEVEERWGDTDAYRESARRTSTYTKQQWLQIKAESSDLSARLAAAMQSGVPADGEQAMDLAEEARQHITRWFYDCPHEIHRGLGDMYVADPRFRKTYEDVAPGLAEYLRDAIHANATRAGG